MYTCTSAHVHVYTDVHSCKLYSGTSTHVLWRMSSGTCVLAHVHMYTDVHRHIYFSAHVHINSDTSTNVLWRILAQIHMYSDVHMFFGTCTHKFWHMYTYVLWRMVVGIRVGYYTYSLYGLSEMNILRQSQVFQKDLSNVYWWPHIPRCLSVSIFFRSG